MELRTQECQSVRRRLFAVLVLLVLMMMVRTESIRADEKLSFDEDGYAYYDLTSGDTSYKCYELNRRTCFFVLQEPALLAFENNGYAQIYNDREEALLNEDGFYEANYNLISLGAGKYYIDGISSMILLKAWEYDDGYSTIQLTENATHTVYHSYYQWKEWSKKDQCYNYYDTTQILAPITFNVENGHVYRISTGNLSMDTANYTSFADCVISDGDGKELLNKSLQLNNGYLDYTAGLTGTVTLYLNFKFQTDASFDISYRDVTCEVAGHIYGAYTVTREATVTSKGKKTAECTVCGTEKTAVIDYKTGVAKASDGKKYYYQSGKISKKTTGLVKCDDKIYKIKKGKVVTNFTGTVQYGGRYYYLKKGISQNDLTSMVKVNGTWYYVEKGIITFQKTGVVKYKKELWYVKKSQLNTQKTGVVKYGKNYIYVTKGKCSGNFTGIVDYGKKQVYVEKGYVNFDYIGKVKYNGKTYNIRGGYVV